MEPQHFTYTNCLSKPLISRCDLPLYQTWALHYNIIDLSGKKVPLIWLNKFHFFIFQQTCPIIEDIVFQKSAISHPSSIIIIIITHVYSTVYIAVAWYPVRGHLTTFLQTSNKNKTLKISQKKHINQKKSVYKMYINCNIWYGSDAACGL